MQNELFEQPKIIDPGFNELWERYQKKVGKKDAMKAWKKLTKRKQSEILNGDTLDKYVHSTPNKQYRMHLSTWLNGEHWYDEIITKNTSGLSNEELGGLATIRGI